VKKKGRELILPNTQTNYKIKKNLQTN